MRRMDAVAYRGMMAVAMQQPLFIPVQTGAFQGGNVAVDFRTAVAVITFLAGPVIAALAAIDVARRILRQGVSQGGGTTGDYQGQSREDARHV